MSAVQDAAGPRAALLLDAGPMFAALSRDLRLWRPTDRAPEDATMRIDWMARATAGLAVAPPIATVSRSACVLTAATACADAGAAISAEGLIAARLAAIHEVLAWAAASDAQQPCPPPVLSLIDALQGRARSIVPDYAVLHWPSCSGVHTSIAGAALAAGQLAEAAQIAERRCLDG
jgi:hypothetical protein